MLNVITTDRSQGKSLLHLFPRVLQSRSIRKHIVQEMQCNLFQDFKKKIQLKHTSQLYKATVLDIQQAVLYFCTTAIRHVKKRGSFFCSLTKYTWRK